MNTNNIALFFGSFNPIHNAHIMIAQRIVDQHWADEVWFVVSPHNPMKDHAILATPQHRLNMTQLALANNPKLKPCDIELRLPTPSYTINTMKTLSNHFPNHKFSIIIGADNLNSLHKWKEIDTILNQYSIIVYPRPGIEISNPDIIDRHNLRILNVPMSTTSSTDIRNNIKCQKDISALIPTPVFDYIRQNNLYQ